MKFSSCLAGLLLLANVMDAVWASPLDDVSVEAWTKVDGTSGKKQKVTVDHAKIAEKLAQVSGGGVVNIQLYVTENKSVHCDFRELPVMAPELAAKYPTNIAASGHCSDGSTAILTIDTERPGSLRGHFITDDGDGAQYMVDPDDTPDPSGYFLARVKDSLSQKTSEAWKDTVVHKPNGSVRKWST